MRALGGQPLLDKVKAVEAASKAGKLFYNPGARTYGCILGQAWFRAAALLPVGFDADHIIELVIGGVCDEGATNLHALESSVNRSVGGQIGSAIRELKRQGKLYPGKMLKIGFVDCKKKKKKPI